MGSAEEQLIDKVLTTKKSKRKMSIDSEGDPDDDESSSDGLGKEKVLESGTMDENDLKWAENYIEEQQTQLILSLLDDDAPKDEPNLVEEKEECKSPRATLATLGLGEC